MLKLGRYQPQKIQSSHLHFDLFRRTDFGGFLVCCKIGHPYLNDVENNSVAISLMLSLENA